MHGMSMETAQSVMMYLDVDANYHLTNELWLSEICKCDGICRAKEAQALPLICVL